MDASHSYTPLHISAPFGKICIQNNLKTIDIYTGCIARAVRMPHSKTVTFLESGAFFTETRWNPTRLPREEAAHFRPLSFLTWRAQFFESLLSALLFFLIYIIFGLKIVFFMYFCSRPPSALVFFFSFESALFFLFLFGGRFFLLRPLFALLSG